VSFLPDPLHVISKSGALFEVDKTVAAADSARGFPVAHRGRSGLTILEALTPRARRRQRDSPLG
jgi:hypothetical protein